MVEGHQVIDQFHQYCPQKPEPLEQALRRSGISGINTVMVQGTSNGKCNQWGVIVGSIGIGWHCQISEWQEYCLSWWSWKS